jgi:hypothetical protein
MSARPDLCGGYCVSGIPTAIGQSLGRMAAASLTVNVLQWRVRYVVPCFFGCERVRPPCHHRMVIGVIIVTIFSCGFAVPEINE